MSAKLERLFQDVYESKGTPAAFDTNLAAQPPTAHLQTGTYGFDLPTPLGKSRPSN